MFTQEQIITAVIIFAARVMDVSLGTFRNVLVIRRKRLYAFIVSFFECLIWIYAVSRVITDLTDPITSVAFALGFATGTFMGITIEGLFKIGEQAVRIFSLKGDDISDSLRSQGFRVTVFEGKGRNGPVKMVFVQVKRRNVKKVFKLARTIDPLCFMVVDDICDAYTA
ncbi:DUF2179 domain-containing protein [Treponema parvum]|uniref:DUF2179 domain-containing protein n=1 Tax=Treponema parvum TaxID=138851 RepID=A0A975IBN5_9SPIR|nr:DUF5698 domain-containing protein [Treponema parvum]QTQ10947.1 DUF2179 domain-containing protein [Treponema parvum]